MSTYVITTLDLDSLRVLAPKGQDIVPFSFAGQGSTCYLILDPEVAPRRIAWNTHPRTELVLLLEPRSTPMSDA